MLVSNDPQLIEIPSNPSCIGLPNSVSRESKGSDRGTWSGAATLLYTAEGERKYLNRDELGRFIACVKTFDAERSLFGLLLAYTGARVSEALALTPNSFQLGSNLVTFATLKRRKPSFREVPIPPFLMVALSQHFGLRCAQLRNERMRLWGWTRVRAWRFIKKVMTLADIFGVKACPRGLRHAFGVATFQSGVQLNLIQRWMGHARMSTTAIYANVFGPEELMHARRFWRMTFPQGRHTVASEPMVAACA